jgi:Flp pilus assembly protein TadG
MTYRNRRGGNAIEFALIAPVLITFLIGVMEYSWFFSMNQACVTAAREGARVGSLTDSSDAAVDAAAAAAASLDSIGVSSGDATIACPVGDSSGSYVVTCTVTLSASSMTGFVPVPADYRGVISARMEDQTAP